MKRCCYSFLLLTLLATTGCKIKSGKDEKGTAVSFASDANKVIDYTNDVIDVLGKYSEVAEKSIDYYSELEDKINEDRFLPTNSSGMNFLWTEKKKAANAFGEPTTALGKGKQFFKDSVGAYYKLFSEFKRQDSLLDMYMKAEDFKDDAFAKGKEIISRQYAAFPQMVRLRSAIQKKIEVVADDAETVALKDSPIRDAFKAAKTDLAKFKALTDKIADTEKYTDADLSAIDAAYAELTASLEKNKNADKTNLDKENKTTSYNSFYSSVSQECVKIKPIIRKIKASKVLTDNDYDDINRIYNSVVSDYNVWVN